MTDRPETAQPLPAPGVTLGGRYRLTSRIATGGMGEVWRATDEVLGRVVAVKILRREYAHDSTFRERFRAEARHTATLSHPGVAALYDFGEGDEDSSPYLVMERADGEPLSGVLAREGALPLDRTLEILGNAALGLQAAHEAGVIHRDIKPANIIVNGSAVKITDFGISRATNSVPLTLTGAIMGTAYYISPEQASGSAVTPASDVYSLGVVAYECLSGRRPFAGDTPVSVALAQVREAPPTLPATVPGEVRELVMNLLAKDPAQRPASAGEVAARALALAPRYRGVSPLGAHPDPPTRVLGAGNGGEAIAPPTDPPPRDPRSDTNPGFTLPELRDRGRWLPYAALLAVAALLLFAAVQALAGGDGSEPAGAAGNDASATSVDVIAADLLGRPMEKVRAELRDQGLRVRVEEAGGGAPVGTVKAVEPTGSLPPGSIVTLTWVAGTGNDGEPGGVERQGDQGQPDDKDDEKGKDAGKGKGGDKGGDENDGKDD